MRIYRVYYTMTGIDKLFFMDVRARSSEEAELKFYNILSSKSTKTISHVEPVV